MPGLPNFPVEGGCICGMVRYRLTAAPLGVYNCHCKDCQRSAGSAFSTSMVVRREAFSLSAGETQVYDKRADSGRIVRQHSCAVCATRMFNEPLSSPDIIVLRPGTLDDASWAAPVGAIWTASKAPWVEIAADEPSFPGQALSRDPLFAAWRGRHGIAG
ncbi:MAG: GFA family protein [Devosia sp.]|nr:GFA family protein [Devosia sp.]